MDFKSFENCKYKDEFVKLFNKYIEEGVFDDDTALEVGYKIYDQIHISLLFKRLEDIKKEFIKDVFRDKVFDEKFYDKVMEFFDKLQNALTLGYSKHCIDISDYVEDKLYSEKILPELLIPSAVFKNNITKDFVNMSSNPSIVMDAKSCDVYKEIENSKTPSDIKENIHMVHNRLHEIASYFYELLKEKNAKDAYIAYWRMRYLNLLIVTSISIYTMKQEEAFHKTFFEEHSAPILIVAKDGKIVKANKAALNFYGYTEEEITSMYGWQINTYPKETTDKFVKEAFERNENFFKFKHRLKNGDIKDVHVYSSPVIIEDEKYLASIIHDVSEEIRYQKFFNILKNIEDASISVSSKDKFFEKLVNIFKSDENIEDICIALKENNTLKPVSEYGEVHCIKDNQISLTDDKYIYLPVSNAFINNNIIINQDTESNPYLESVKHEMLQNEKHSSVGIPILENNEIIGSMCICSNKPHYFDNYKEFFEELKSLIHQVLNRFYLENKLKESKEFFEAVSENAVNGVVVYDMDTIYYMNKALMDMLGYTKEDIKNITIFDILSPKHVQELISSFISLESISKNFSAVGKNQKYIDIHFSASIIKTSKGVMGIANILDISEMIKNQHIMETQRKLLQDIMDRIEGGIIVFKLLKDKKIEPIYTNKFFENVGKTEINHIHDILDPDVSVEDIMSSLLTNEEFVLENIHMGDRVAKALLKLLDKEELTILGIFYDITEEYNKLQGYKLQAETDALTGVCNRRCYDKSLDEYINLSKRYNRPLSLIMFDIDYFKLVNDSFGHDAGDIVLKSLADIVSKNIRNTDILSRYGGEEFMIIAPETSLKEAIVLAEKLRNIVESNIIFYNEIELNITCSFGVTSLRESDTKESLEKRADELLYMSKKNGRNRVSHDESLGVPSIKIEI